VSFAVMGDRVRIALIFERVRQLLQELRELEADPCLFLASWSTCWHSPGNITSRPALGRTRSVAPVDRPPGMAMARCGAFIPAYATVPC
jgi:hypothetical protein